MLLKGPPTVASASAVPLMLICARDRRRSQPSVERSGRAPALTEGFKAVSFTGMTCPTVEMPTEVQLRIAVPWGSNSGKMSCEGQRRRGNEKREVSEGV